MTRNHANVHLNGQDANPDRAPGLQIMTTHARSERKQSPWLFGLTHWNWKVALMTAVLRGLACIFALRHMEHHARNHFGVVEAAFVLATCGFFSALQQQSLEIRSELLAWFCCVVVVPFSSLGIDAGLHFWLDGRDTRQLGLAGLIFTLVSATFHWHMIRNGALLVGEESHSFVTDLKRIPKLMLSYFTIPAIALWRWTSTLVRRNEAAVALGAGD
ncbi:MAG: hypothetical protein ACLGXA_03890 [Acidobacteriota bacterium]